MRARAVVLGLAVTLAVPAAACGNDGEPTAATGTTTTTAPTTATTATTASDGDATTTAAPAGATPDPCTLVAAAEVEAVAGLGATAAAEDGESIDGLAFRQCVWEAEATSSLVAVAVVEGADRYEQHAERGLGEPVDGLGDEALVEAGVSLETHGATGGRTVVVLDGDRTVSVAVKRQGETPVDEVVTLAASVLDRLG